MTRKAYQKTVKGEELKFFSTEHNGMIDAAVAFKNNQQGNNVPGGFLNTKTGIVDVQNISGQTVDQFHYMVVEDFIFKPSDNEDFFRNNAAFKVNVFDETNQKHDGAALVILLQPIKANEVGLAMIVGSNQIRVNVVDESHKFATLKTGQTVLESAAGGEVALISQESGTGELWAYGSFPNIVTEQQFRVKRLDVPDTLTCVTYDGTNEGTKEIQVAMPWELRLTPFDGQVWHDITFNYIDFQHREAVFGEDDPVKVIILPLYKEDDIVVGSRNIGGGLDAIDASTGNQAEWLDANKGGRYWATDDSEEEEEEE